MSTSFIDRLNKLRGNMNVSEFARFLGINQTTLNLYIRNERKPSVELVVTVCERCDVSSDWLLGLKTHNDAGTSDAHVDWKTRCLKAEAKNKKASEICLMLKEELK